MITFREVAVIDRNSEYRGVPPSQLMENAGRNLAEVIEENYPNRKVLFICGTGNNAGDAFVAARYMTGWRKEAEVKVFLLKNRANIRSDIARENFHKMQCKVIDEMEWEGIEEFVLVDALLGTGVTGKIREPYRTTIQIMNELKNPIISVDVPSGLNSDLQVDPDITVTFHDVKEGMTEENCGKIIIKDIGIPEEAIEYTGPGEMLLYPVPYDESHKGDNGTLLIVGGGPYIGAPALAGFSAYRTGVDLVYLAVPEDIKDVIAGYSPSFITEALEGNILKTDHVDKIIKLSEKCDALLIGPGLGTDNETKNAVLKIIKRIDIPTIIDADGLKAIKDDFDVLKKGSVFTPHKGELKILTESYKDPQMTSDELAQQLGVVLLVKGKVDYITDGKRSKKNDFGSPAMTVGGTGDTLAGVVGALLAKGMTPFDAARTAAYITGRAGEYAFEKFSWGLLPEDVSKGITEVLKEI